MLPTRHILSNYRAAEVTMELPCQEKSNFVLACAKAMNEYSDAISLLIRAIGTVPESEFELLRRKATVARDLSKDASEQLRKHAAEHHC